MSDRYHGSAYRGRGGPPRDDRPYPPRHYRDEHDYPDARPSYAHPRDPYHSSHYAEHREYGYGRPPRRERKAIPPPRPWDYSRRPVPRTEAERIELEREREAWEAKEAERYRQRMDERDRERERDAQRAGQSTGGYNSWDRDYEAAEDRMYRSPQGGYDRHAPPPGPRRQRSRSPVTDPNYGQRDSWGRGSVGSADEARDREMDRLAAAPGAERGSESTRYPQDGYPARRSPPPPTAPSQPLETPETQRYGAPVPDRPSPPIVRGTPRGPAAATSGFSSTPPTGPRAGGYSRRGGGPPYPSSAPRGGREGSGSAGPYTPGSDRGEASSYLSPSNARFPRSARDGPPAAYRGGHPSYGRVRRDTNPYDSNFGGAAEDEGVYRPYGSHTGSSPHEGSPFSPSTSTPGGPHLSAPRLSRTSSSQTPATPGIPGATNVPTGPAAMLSPSTSTPLAPTAAPAIPRFSAAYKLCPDLDAELLAIEAQRTAFISNFVLGSKRAAIRTARMELKDAELEYMTATSRRQAAERALEVARETADAYSLEENRKEQLQTLLAQQIQQQQQMQQQAIKME